MAAVDLLVKNGTVVLPEGSAKADVAVSDGKIVVVGSSGSVQAETVIDASSKFVLPGLIDAHVHFVEPGGESREDFESGTKAAAAGGITTVFEMPICSPPVTSAETFRRRRDIIEGKALVDFAMYGGAGTHNIDHILELAKEGVIGYKTFMAYPKQRDTWYKGTYPVDNGSLYEVLEKVAETRLPISVHAEEDTIVERLTERLRKSGRKDPRAHNDARPPFAELVAISTVSILAKATGARVHIAHISTAGGVSTVEAAKRDGVPITAETCAQYLTLTDGAISDVGAFAKVNPPIRGVADSDALWAGLKTGIVDTVASDHAPWGLAQKEEGKADIFNAPSGIPGVETTLPLMLTEVNNGRITLNDLARVMSESVAKIFGIYPRKGRVVVGSDADLTVVDLKVEAKIDVHLGYSKSRAVNPFDGRVVRGAPIATIVRGNLVMKDHEIVGKGGTGEFISPSVVPR